MQPKIMAAKTPTILSRMSLFIFEDKGSCMEINTAQSAYWLLEFIFDFNVSFFFLTSLLVSYLYRCASFIIANISNSRTRLLLGSKCYLSYLILVHRELKLQILLPMTCTLFSESGASIPYSSKHWKLIHVLHFSLFISPPFTFIFPT